MVIRFNGDALRRLTTDILPITGGRISWPASSDGEAPAGSGMLQRRPWLRENSDAARGPQCLLDQACMVEKAPCHDEGEVNRFRESASVSSGPSR